MSWVYRRPSRPQQRRRFVPIAGVEAQTLSGAAFAPAIFHPTGTVAPGAVTLTGVLFNPAVDHPAGAITTTYTLDGVLFSPVIDHPAGTLEVGAATLTGVLFAPAVDHPIGTVTPGAVTLTGALFAPAIDHPVGTISEGAVTLSGVAFVPAITHSAGTVTPGAVSLTGVLFSPTLTHPVGTVAVGAQTLDGTLFTPAVDHPAGTLTATYDLTGVAFVPAIDHPTGTLVVGAITLSGVLFSPAIDHPTGEVSQATTIVQTEPGDADSDSIVGVIDRQVDIYPPTSLAATDGIPVTVDIIQLLDGALFSPNVDHAAGTLVVGAATLTGTLFVPSINHPVGAVTPGAVSLTGILFSPTVSHSVGTVVVGALTLTGVLFAPTINHSAGNLVPTYDLTGVAFSPAIDHPVGTVSAGIPLDGVLFSPAIDHPAGTIAPGTVELTGVLFSPAIDHVSGAVVAGVSVVQTEPADADSDFIRGSVTRSVEVFAPVADADSVAEPAGREHVISNAYNIDYVGHRSDYIGFTGSGVTVQIDNLSAGSVQQGDLIFIAVYGTGNNIDFQDADSRGYTRVWNQNTGGFGTAAMFWKEAGASEVNPRFNGVGNPGHEWHGIVNVYRPYGTSTFDITHDWGDPGTHYEDGLNDPTPPNKAITTIRDNAIVMVFNANTDDNGTNGVPSGYTAAGNTGPSTFHSFHAAYKRVTTAGTETPGDWTHTGKSAGNDWAVWTVAIRPSGGPFTPALSFPDGDVINGLAGVLFTPAIDHPVGKVQPGVMVEQERIANAESDFISGSITKSVEVFAPVADVDSHVLDASVVSGVYITTRPADATTDSPVSAVTRSLEVSLPSGDSSTDAPTVAIEIQKILTGVLFSPAIEFPAGLTIYDPLQGVLFTPGINHYAGTIFPCETHGGITTARVGIWRVGVDAECIPGPVFGSFTITGNASLTITGNVVSVELPGHIGYANNVKDPNNVVIKAGYDKDVAIVAGRSVTVVGGGGTARPVKG